MVKSELGKNIRYIQSYTKFNYKPNCQIDRPTIIGYTPVSMPEPAIEIAYSLPDPNIDLFERCATAIQAVWPKAKIDPVNPYTYSAGEIIAATPYPFILLRILSIPHIQTAYAPEYANVLTYMRMGGIREEDIDTLELLLPELAPFMEFNPYSLRTLRDINLINLHEAEAKIQGKVYGLERLSGKKAVIPLNLKKRLSR